MPLKKTMERAERDRREGKSVSTQAGEFVREEIDRIRSGEHGARSAKQAIAIGLSEARRAGVKLPPKPGDRKSAKPASSTAKKPSIKRSRASLEALKRETTNTVSPAALSRQASDAAAKRSPAARKEAAAKAVRTKGAAGLKSAGQKAARTRRNPR